MKPQFSVRNKAGKIMANAVVGMSEFRTDHGLPRPKIYAKNHVGEPGIKILNILGLDFLSRDPWEIPPPVFCQPSEENAIANGVQ